MNGAGPIGVFDSGLGGLTVVQALKRAMPEAPILYIGDTAHLPYGDKSPELLHSYVGAVTRFLVAEGASSIVVACNTASSVAIQAVHQQASGLPVFNVIDPAVAAAAAAYPNGRIGVIGTTTTVQSGVYRARLGAAAPGAVVIEKATPLLVPLLEEGWLDHPLCGQVLEAYLSDSALQTLDALILGCTHYPLLTSAIQAAYQKFGRQVALVSSSTTTAQQVAAAVKETRFAPGPDRYCVTDLTPHFAHMAARLTAHAPRLEALGRLEPVA